MYLFVCFDLLICSRIDGFFGISTFSVLILVFHEFGILCMRVKYFKKSPSGIVVVSGIQPEKAQTPIAWERPATLVSDTPRPLYGQKTPKKLVGFNVSFQTVHWTRIGHASVTVGVCFYLVERSQSARRKEPLRACSEQTNRNKPL